MRIVCFFNIFFILISSFTTSLEAGQSYQAKRVKKGSYRVYKKQNVSIVLGNPKAKHELVALLSPSCDHCRTFVLEYMGDIIKKYDIKITVLFNPLHFLDLSIAQIILGYSSSYENLKFFMKTQKDWLKPYTYRTTTSEKKESLERYPALKYVLDTNDILFFLKLFLYDNKPPFAPNSQQERFFLDKVPLISANAILDSKERFRISPGKAIDFTPAYFLDGKFIDSKVDVRDALKDFFKK